MEQKDILNLISNEQRKYFGLQEIDPSWKSFMVSSQNFQGFDVTIFVDGLTVKKCIVYGQKKYKEIQLNEPLSKNYDYILPKDSSKKPSTIDSIVNKSAFGVTLSFDAPITSIYNEQTHKMFYTNFFDKNNATNSVDEFKTWMENWCNESSQSDIDEINKFANQTAKTEIKYNEGDVFRVKLSRREYGYGRILLDYNKMRRENEPFWDCLMGSPIIVSLYHILTNDKTVSIDYLKNLRSFPSEIIMDNNIKFADYEIIGNIPVDYEKEDYPIMYGKALDGSNKINFQRGKQFLQLDGGELISRNFKNNGVSSNLGIDISLMKKCIEEESNLPYYQNGPYVTRTDLRNPTNSEFLQKILSQFNLQK